MHPSEWFTDPSPVWFRVVASIPRYSGKLRQTWNSCEKFIAAQVVQWPAFLYKKRIFFNSASVLLNSLMNKVVVHSKKACYFISSTEKPSKNMSFEKTTSQNHVWIKSSANLCFFIVTSSLTNYQSILGEISCVIPYYVEIKDSLYLAKILFNLLEN